MFIGIASFGANPSPFVTDGRTGDPVAPAVHMSLSSFGSGGTAARRFPGVCPSHRCIRLGADSLPMRSSRRSSVGDVRRTQTNDALSRQSIAL